MKDSCHLTYARCPQTHTHYTEDMCYQSWHMLLICLSPVMSHTTLFISPDFPRGKRVCVHVCVYVCPAEAPAWVFISSTEKRFLASFDTVLDCLLRCLPMACNFLNQTHMLSTEQSYYLHTKSLAGNDNLIIFWTHLTSLVFHFDIVLIADLHTVVTPLCPVEAFIF